MEDFAKIAGYCESNLALKGAKRRTTTEDTGHKALRPLSSLRARRLPLLIITRLEQIHALSIHPRPRGSLPWRGSRARFPRWIRRRRPRPRFLPGFR